jgi:hypothetical protein
MPTVQTTHAPVQNSSYKKLFTLSVCLYIQASLCRGRRCSFAFNFQCNVFFGLSSIVSLCLVLTLSLYYRSSFSILFFYILLHVINERMYIVYYIHSKILQLIGFHTMFHVLIKMFHCVPFTLLSLC